jgi:hypothetical protein
MKDSEVGTASDRGDGARLEPPQPSPECGALGTSVRVGVEGSPSYLDKRAARLSRELEAYDWAGLR